MTEFSYDIVEDEYGEKLAIEFEYDEDIKNRLKGLEWGTTLIVLGTRMLVHGRLN